MKKIDIIFAIICGLAVAWIAADFFGKYGWIFFIILPVLSVIGLWVVEQIGRKFLFVHQAGKFALAGAFADVVDIKVFQIIFWLAPFSSLAKAASFIAGTFVKYFCDKHWAFEKHERNDMHKEMAKFFLVAVVGLGINVVSFNFFGTIKTGLAFKTWQELCIILAALVTAIWNFCGYKFFVFKK
ncbi:MAG: GtrA family protein [Candidatus Staskawiczbacteria bacterium]|jgi:putative flippase GtrA